MKTQYKLLKDLPAFSAGIIFDCDNLGHITEHTFPMDIRIKPDTYPDWFQPLPQPKEEKKSCILTFEDNFSNESNIYIDEELHLTEPAAQAVATAIQALLEYVNKPDMSMSTNGTVGDLDDKILKARAAVQKDSNV